jgi:hypothetical protein
MLHSTMSHHFATFEAVACRAVVPATFQGDAFLFMCFFVNNQHSFLAQPAATHQCSHQILQMIPLNCPAITTTFINVCMSTHIIYIDSYYVSYLITFHNHMQPNLITATNFWKLPPQSDTRQESWFLASRPVVTSWIASLKETWCWLMILMIALRVFAGFCHTFFIFYSFLDFSSYFATFEAGRPFLALRRNETIEICT